MPTHEQKIKRDLYPGFIRNSVGAPMDFSSLDVCYVTDQVEFRSTYTLEELPSAPPTATVELHHIDGQANLMDPRYFAYDIIDYDTYNVPPQLANFFYRTETRPVQFEQPYGFTLMSPYFTEFFISVSSEAQTGTQAPPFANPEAKFKAIPGIFEYQRDGYSKTFEVRELALENFRVVEKVVNPESISPYVTIKGDVRVYPNPFTNDLPAWTPENDIDWQVQLKHPLLSNIVLSGTISPGMPDNTGLVAQLEIEWDPAQLATPIEIPLEIEGALRLMLDSGGGTVSRPATTNCIISRGRCTDWFTGLMRETEAVSVYSGSPDLSTAVAYSASSSGNAPASFGYGWFSTESIRIIELPDESLVYRDELGLFRRWKKIGTNQYESLFADNKMTITVDSDPDATYIVTWRDQRRRIFDEDGVLQSSVDRNGRTVTYTRGASYLSVEDDYGRIVYNHFENNELQPRVINDNINKNLGRRYVLDYYMNGTDQERLKSITDPVGDMTLFIYGADNRLAERREVLTNHTRSIFYTYDASNTGRLASMKVSSTLLPQGANPAVVTDHYQTDYAYNVPFVFDSDGSTGPNLPITYTTTLMTVKDLEDTTNPDRVSYLAYDSLSSSQKVWQMKIATILFD